MSFTGGWLARKSPPYTVSSKCCQVESPSPFRFLAALMPPCAHTECERFTGTMENKSTWPPISAILMTAESPASPPPITIIFGCDAMSFGFPISAKYFRRVIVPANESCVPLSGPIGCSGVMGNERMVSAPTRMNVAPITKQTYLKPAPCRLAGGDPPLGREQPQSIGEVPAMRKNPDRVKNDHPAC